MGNHQLKGGSIFGNCATFESLITREVAVLRIMAPHLRVTSLEKWHHYAELHHI